MTSMLDEYNAMSEEKHMEICHKADELQKKNLGEKLSEEDKAVADKAAELIARDYGETLRRLAEEDKEDAKYRKSIVK